MTETGITFSEAEETLLKQSFSYVSASPRVASEIFYKHLFSIAPEVRDLFLNDMERQGDKLVATLSAVVTQIGNLRSLTPAIEELGLRHVAYGVSPDHYAATGSALFEMLGEMLGERFTPETRAAWEKAYAAISAIMIAAVETRKSARRADLEDIDETGGLDG